MVHTVYLNITYYTYVIIGYGIEPEPNPPDQLCRALAKSKCALSPPRNLSQCCLRCKVLKRCVPRLHVPIEYILRPQSTYIGTPLRLN